jgi:hypothetical protein
MTRDLARTFTGAKDGQELEDGCMPMTMTPQVRFRTVDGVRVRHHDGRHAHGRLRDIGGVTPWPAELNFDSCAA